MAPAHRGRYCTWLLTSPLRQRRVDRWACPSRQSRSDAIATLRNSRNVWKKRARCCEGSRALSPVLAQSGPDICRQTYTMVIRDARQAGLGKTWVIIQAGLNQLQLVLLFTSFLTIPLARQRFFHATLFARLQVEGVTLHFLDDVLLLNLTLKPAQRIFKRLAFLYANLCQETTPPNRPNRAFIEYRKLVPSYHKLRGRDIGNYTNPAPIMAARLCPGKNLSLRRMRR